MKNLFLLTMIISSLAQSSNLQAAEETTKLLATVKKEEQRVVDMVKNLNSPVSALDLDAIEATLDQNLRRLNPEYKKIYDEILILQVQREQDDCCCVSWLWRSKQDMQIEEQRTKLLQEVVVKTLGSQTK